MISAKTNIFKYIDRNKPHTIALIPGWATDYRIFDELDLDFNYIIPISFSPWGFVEDLAGLSLKKKLSKISLLGYSLGGFIAAEFSSRYPGLVDKLILVGIRKRYGLKEIEEVRRSLKKNKRAYLYKFYKTIFYQKDELKRFKDRLLKAYLDEFDLDHLLSTLDYLGGSQISYEPLKSIKTIKLIHGEEDKIAPLREAIEIKNNLEAAQLITLKETGHNPFFRGDVSSYFKSFIHNVLCK